MRVRLAGWFSLRDEFLSELRKELEEKERVREELIVKSRELRLNSSKAIANIHSGNIQKAEEFLEKAEERLEEILKYSTTHPDLFYLAQEAIQEYVEAYAFLHIIHHHELPEELPVRIPQSALPGLADCIGELRRYALTLMVKNENFELVERLIEIMEELYFTLINFDFHDRLTGNLRPKLDVARNAIERTKSDFLTARVFKKF